MSHNGNTILMENLFEDLQEAGFTKDEIIEHDLVDKLFFEEATIDELVEQFLGGDDQYPHESWDMSDDGDALASAGFGTDEDYGGYDEYI